MLSISDSTAVRSGPHCGPPPNRTALHFNRTAPPPDSSAVHFNQHCCSFQSALLFISPSTAVDWDSSAARNGPHCCSFGSECGPNGPQCCRSGQQCCPNRLQCSTFQRGGANRRAPVGRSCACRFCFPPRNGVCYSTNGSRRGGWHDDFARCRSTSPYAVGSNDRPLLDCCVASPTCLRARARPGCLEMSAGALRRG